MNKSQVKTKEDLELYYTKVRKIRFKENDLKFELEYPASTNGET